MYICQADFEPAVYLEYFKFGKNPLGDDFLHFLLKHNNAAFKSGASLLQPGERFVGGRVTMQIWNQTLIFNPEKGLGWERRRVAR